ncbi:MAG: HAMP domain-containing sensor histidine kinase [Bacillota bacterium]
MKKLSFKITAAVLFVVGAVTVAQRVATEVVTSEEFIATIGSPYIVWGMGIVVFVSLTIFSLIINQIMVRKIVRLSDATKLVANGDFSKTIYVNGKDELATLYDNFNTMTRQLQSNEYLAKGFVRNVSHEFKTPLSSISGFADLIQQETTNPDIVKYAEIIQSEAVRLNDMGKILIEISSLDSTTIVKKEDTYKISAQIRDIITGMQQSFESKNITFDIELSEAEIISNEKLTYQIWQNLIGNAIKFSYENEVIKIRLNVTDNGATFTIENFGEPIKDEDKSKIFNQFYMGNSARNESGSGLGLSIAKMIAEKLEGAISVSTDGNNTKFTVTI